MKNIFPGELEKWDGKRKIFRGENRMYSLSRDSKIHFCLGLTVGKMMSFRSFLCFFLP